LIFAFDEISFGSPIVPLEPSLILDFIAALRKLARMASQQTTLSYNYSPGVSLGPQGASSV
jgi:hypothetical protein